MNPDPRVFGPHMWFTLHSISFFYPENPNTNDMLLYKEFYEKFSNFIPCKKCSVHYNLYVHNYPIDGYLNTRESLARWVVNLHNSVNRKLNKREMPFDEVYRTYRGLYRYEHNVQKQNNIMYLSIFAIIGAYIYWRIHTK